MTDAGPICKEIEFEELKLYNHILPWELSRDDVLRGPGLDNAVVASCLRLWRGGRISWEQAMMFAVVGLSSEVKSLQKKAMAQMEHEPAPALPAGLDTQTEFMENACRVAREAKKRLGERELLYPKSIPFACCDCGQPLQFPSVISEITCPGCGKHFPR